MITSLHRVQHILRRGYSTSYYLLCFGGQVLQSAQRHESLCHSQHMHDLLLGHQVQPACICLSFKDGIGKALSTLL